jgi:hypothetical protein
MSGGNPSQKNALSAYFKPFLLGEIGKFLMGWGRSPQRFLKGSFHYVNQIDKQKYIVMFFMINSYFYFILKKINTSNAYEPGNV